MAVMIVPYRCNHCQNGRDVGHLDDMTRIPTRRDTKSTKATKNGEGHEEGQSSFVFFQSFFVVFVAFVLSRLVAAAPY